MTNILTPGVPANIANLYETGAVKWETGWGDYNTHTCLHGALLRPCAVPGDEIMWSILLSHRGLTIDWNDDQGSGDPVIVKLREQVDPDEAEMVAVFGPNWVAARNICRTWATATADQKQAVQHAQPAWAAHAAHAAWAAWAAWAARAARAALAALDAWDARAAFFATVAQPWIGTTPEWTQPAYDRLIAPWVQVFGPIK